MYLFIFEDGSNWLEHSFSDDNRKAAAEGYLQVFKVAADPIPQKFIDGEWVMMEVEIIPVMESKLNEEPTPAPEPLDARFCGAA